MPLCSHQLDAFKAPVEPTLERTRVWGGGADGGLDLSDLLCHHVSFPSLARQAKRKRGQSCRKRIMSCCTNPQRDSLTVAVKEIESAAQTGATKRPDLALGPAVTGAGLCRASPMRFLALR